LEFNYPELFWDPVLRAAALSQLGKEQEARAAVSELLKLEPEFAMKGRRLISNYVKVDEVAAEILEGLRKAGLDDLE
jgi:adenylate cyclase